jgi:hypothetical protein
MHHSHSVLATVPRAGARLARTRPACRLRHEIGRATHAVMGERQAPMAVVLRQLAAEHVPLTAVIPGEEHAGTVVEFADGTRLLLRIRYGGDDMGRLDPAGHGLLAWLAEARPCFGGRSFWLWFTSAGCTVSAEVLTSVSPVPPDAPQDDVRRPADQGQ